MVYIHVKKQNKTRSLLLSCLNWCIAAFLDTLQAPVDQWNILKLLEGTCMPRKHAHAR